MDQKCPSCFSTNVSYDGKSGELVCEECGTIIDAFAVDDSVEFVENTTGGASLVSRFVTHEGEGAGIVASRSVTFKKGGDRIENVSALLRIDGDRNVVDFAKSIYQDAVEKRLTYRRSARITAAACVYLAARYKNKELMLIDMAEKCQLDVTNVFRAFSDLCFKLNLKVPFHDPCLFVARFAYALGLGQQTSDVIKISTTFVRRMKTDFITLGRYPTGVIAAALIFACRSLGIHKSVDDLVKVVNLHHSTIKKRMMEFAQTESAKLTTEELRRRDATGQNLPGSDLPPCVVGQKIKARMPQPKPPSAEEINSMVKLINSKLEKARERYQRMIMARYMTGNLDDREVEKETEEIITEDVDAILNEDLSDENEEEIEPAMERKKQKQLEYTSTLVGTGFDDEDRDQSRCPKFPKLWEWAQRGDRKTFEMCAKDDGDLDLTGINDEELSTYLCASDHEVLNRKRCFWNPEYDVFLKEKARRRILRQKLSSKTKQRKKRVPKVKQSELRGNTAAESFEKMVKKTPLGKKIDSEHYKNVMKFLGEGEEVTEKDFSLVSKQECVDKPTSSITDMKKEFTKKEDLSLIADDYIAKEDLGKTSYVQPFAPEDIVLDDNDYFEEDDHLEEEEEPFEEY
ncbi:transcription factor IIIB 90 kDa subunit-like [Artemia franciscana]|uniref:B-related factor 1 n=1 Tax=Artemia franciscana TaxID=6661 RepID=A0AA88L2A9_ARTSF|nr:hypothetical protein QYM36_011933 [Artemia franciscana]